MVRSKLRDGDTDIVASDDETSRRAHGGGWPPAAPGPDLKRSASDWFRGRSGATQKSTKSAPYRARRGGRNCAAHWSPLMRWAVSTALPPPSWGVATAYVSPRPDVPAHPERPCQHGPDPPSRPQHLQEHRQQIPTENLMKLTTWNYAFLSQPSPATNDPRKRFPWARTTNAIGRLNEEFRRKIKTQTVLPAQAQIKPLGGRRQRISTTFETHPAAGRQRSCRLPERSSGYQDMVGPAGLEPATKAL